MNIQITQAEKTPTGTYVQAGCGNVTALVAIYSHGLQVICQNAAHKVWRRGGKHFRTAAEALANYKSSEMKSIIQAAVDFNATKD